VGIGSARTGAAWLDSATGWALTKFELEMLSLRVICTELELREEIVI